MNTRFAALTMTLIMLLSIGLASAAIPDGDFYADADAAKGIDRNPTPPEVDSTGIARTYDPVSTHSNVAMTFDSSLVRNSNAVAPGAELFSNAGGAWAVAAGTASVGPGDTATWVANNGGTATHHQGINITVGEAAGSTSVQLTDVTGEQSMETIFHNWYSSLDRTQAHGVGSTNNNARIALNGCATVDTIKMKCNLNADFDGTTADGIEPTLVTDLFMRPADSGATAAMAYALHADKTTSSLYFGIDHVFAYNISVHIDGVAMEEGNTKNIAENSEIVIHCADAKCTQDPVVITAPVGYNATGFDAVAGLPATENRAYNSTTRVAFSDVSTIKLTFGVDASDQAEAGVSGVLWDPSLTIETTEPGLEIGVVSNGELSWCASKWFLATCSGSETFDGNESDGLDGIIMKMNLPLESFYSLAAWGGFDSAVLKVTHTNTNACFSGNINTHIMTESQYDAITSKKDLTSFLKFGNYHDFGPVGTADSTQSLGTSASKYCMGASSGVLETSLQVDALADITSDPLLVSYNNGIYDVYDRMFEFYVFVGVAGDATNNDMVIDLQNNLPTITFKHATNYDPLSEQNGITRTTSTTNQTNPAFATPYVMHYSGITPSANIVQGRELVGIDTSVGDFGVEQGGVQAGPYDERKTFAFAPNATTPRSTVECGIAVADGDVVESSISIFTNLDTSGHTGVNESEWKAYGTLASNSSLFTMGPVDGTNTGTLAVDNKETNSGSSTVSYTGVFINGDSYKAVCTHKVSSFDVGTLQENMTTQTITLETFFTAEDDPNYSTGGGGDVETDEESWIDSLDGWDVIFLAVGLGLAFMALYMLFGPGAAKISDYTKDMRVAMALLGVGLLHAWAADHYFYDFQGGSITEETSLVLGSMGYAVMGLALWFYVRSVKPSDKMGMSATMIALGLYLILFGIPSAITGFLDLDYAVFDDAIWQFPLYDLVAAVGTLLGGIVLSLMTTNLVSGAME
jgi:hypothetical protein